ncbi:pyruvate kinase [Spizellomyces punctatus DAOM BR117]|uniref:Pyruvate kinase n=1 Tax=Spizellomyces punctatus (strain DAOM BR117) TaxID=645134 RepID=A0A0L0HMC4_SPIPD|nr:pyruvate kinase [Spizellomyces punctatus DAOM BR117]KND02257.1 pyruvate kinase [Spizellomyces punctatus DAOM BR117]|eukprot:XP_016610296.1 pyruvate kinase [Spizellomyces punctatus DAOM BR117]
MVAFSRRIHPAHLDANSSDILRTKVVCTIGPASCSKEMIGKLVEAGMNIARLNLSHCTQEFATQVISDIRTYLQESGSTAEVATWLDINGPKVRSGRLVNGEPVQLIAGDDFYFVNDADLLGDNTRISTSYTKELVKVGDKMYIDDGLLSFTVVERLEDSIRCKVDNTGILGENKGINFPSHVIEDLPAVSDKDKADISYAMAQNVDFISVSCIRNIDDVEEVRLLLGNHKVKLLAKIENKRGMDNFESILKMADGIVIDRGYLGAEVDVDLVTVAQKKMISMANVAGKPILVANQMLESMRTNPRPSRSEAADVANAVMDGVDGLVLSGETAIGEYVLESVDSMRRIAYQAEKNTNYLEYQVKTMRSIPKPIPVSESIASSAVLAARQVDAAIIVCITELGGTARLVAKYRPQIPVVAATLIPQTARQLNVNFGLVPYYHTGTADTVIPDTLKYAVELGLCQPGQVAVVTSGQHIGFLEGTTTKMQLLQIPA